MLPADGERCPLMASAAVSSSGRGPLPCRHVSHMAILCSVRHCLWNRAFSDPELGSVQGVVSVIPGPEMRGSLQVAHVTVSRAYIDGVWQPLHHGKGTFLCAGFKLAWGYSTHYG